MISMLSSSKIIHLWDSAGDSMKIYAYQGRCNLAGVRVREAREAAGLSQEQLAARLQLLGLEITQKSISRVETGLRVLPDYELKFFADALQTSVLWLLSE